MSTIDQRNRAHGLVNAFRSRSSNVVWFNVQRAQVADDLDVRVDAPEKISQNDTLWCGYASILYSAARDQPQKLRLVRHWAVRERTRLFELRARRAGPPH